MHTVREIDLKAASFAVLHHFVYSGRTEKLTRVAVFIRATRMANIGLQDVQVTRLVFVVRSPGMVYVRQFVESQLAVKEDGGGRSRLPLVILFHSAHPRVAGSVGVSIP